MLSGQHIGYGLAQDVENSLAKITLSGLRWLAKNAESVNELGAGKAAVSPYADQFRIDHPVVEEGEE